MDNSRDNLRLATPLHNSWHRRGLRRNKTGYIGVIERRGKRGVSYQAKIVSRGKVITIGTFDTPERAAVAYDRKAVELRGLWAVTNFPIEEYY